MLPIKEFYSINASEKDNLYADRMIRFIRMNAQPLVSFEVAKKGMDILFANQDMSAIENLFQDPALINLTNRALNRTGPGPLYGVPATGLVNQFNQPIDNPGQDTHISGMQGVHFRSMPVLIKAFRIMIAEMKKMGPVVTVRANDPTSTEKRKQDEILIKNRKKIEGLLSYLYMNAGQSPVDMSQYKDRFGEKPDNGNTSQFDKIGLNNDDPDDVGNFMDIFYKLDWESDMETLINAVLSLNDVQQNLIQMWATDIVAKNAAAARVYVSDNNGQIINPYLSPETVYIYGATGRRQDFNDAMAKGFEQQVTIKQFLDQVGDEFDWQAHLGSLILAVFYGSNGAVDITDINPDYRGYGYADGVGNGGDGGWFAGGPNGSRYTWNDFMNFKVNLGYMEWSSQNYTDFGEKEIGKGQKFDNKKAEEDLNRTGEVGDGWGSASPNNVKPNGKKYQTQARYECPTYKSWYLALTSYNHVKFDFGKATYQDIEGYNDVNANFSILTWKETGHSIALLAEDMINIINEAWYKWRMILRKSKAPGMDYNLDSLEAVSKVIFCDTEGRENRIQNTLEFLNASSNTVWKFVEVDGKVSGMNVSQLNIPHENGLPKNFMTYWEVITSTWDKLIDMLIGSSDLRQGDSASPRASMNNEFKALENSQASTSFIPDIITFLCRQLSVRNAMIAADIIQFKDYDTLAYKALQDMVGDEKLDRLAAMGPKAMHRFGIFVESLNQGPIRQKLSNRIDFALQSNAITLAQAILVEDQKSPSEAFKVLAFFEQRNIKIKQKEAQQQQQAQAQQAQAQQQAKADLAKMEVDGKIQVANITAKAAMQNHITNQQGQLAKQQMKQTADTNDIYHQANADLLKEQQQIANTGQPSAPPLQPPMPNGQPQRFGPPLQAPPSVAQQQQDQSQPSANLPQQ